MRVKKFRQPLIINGVEIRTLEELRENFDAEKIFEYFKDGTLLKWLDTWHYSDEAEKIRELDDADIEELCKIFGVENSEEILWRTERLNRLKKFTSDEKILAQVDNVAFDQEDLLDILEEGAIKEIYLCGEKFTFSSGMLKFENKTYHGVGNVTVKIESRNTVDLDALKINFDNIKLEGNFHRPQNADNTPPDKLQILIDKANSGNVDAMFKLGEMYYRGEELNKDFQKAVEWYKKAAYLKNASAMNNLGHMYYYGEGVKKNLHIAAEWFEKATRLGNSRAMNNLGVMYRDAYRNLEKAVEWYKKSAELGNATAMNNLGGIYRRGEGVNKDFQKAVEWYEKAADLGNSYVMYNLGWMYENVKGVNQDLKKAIEWYKKAADLGNDNAIRALERLKKI